MEQVPELCRGLRGLPNNALVDSQMGWTWQQEEVIGKVTVTS